MLLPVSACLSVCLLDCSKFTKKEFWQDGAWHGAWPKEQTNTFWRRSASRSGSRVPGFWFPDLGTFKGFLVYYSDSYIQTRIMKILSDGLLSESSSRSQLEPLRRSTIASQYSLSPEIGGDQTSVVTKLVCQTSTRTTRSTSPVPTKWTTEWQSDLTAKGVVWRSPMSEPSYVAEYLWDSFSSIIV